MTPTAEEQIRFLQNVQRVLEEGSFTATYKYALLLTLADIAVERGDDSGGALFVPLDEIAERFVRYYWRQARPYQPGGNVVGQVLKQNTGRQAAIVTFVGQHLHTTLPQLRREQATWRRLLGDTRRTIVDQPLWKLQMIGRQPLAFLYHQPEDIAEARRTFRQGIELRPGVAFCLRRFHGLVFDLVTAAWVRFVRQLPENRDFLGHKTDLGEFLFGTERASLDGYRPILTDLQKDACFYCAKRLEGPSNVDHFVPWSRYPVDLAHNFVLAHPLCNNKKRDRLAALPHLERWVRRNYEYHDELGQRFASAKLAYDLESSDCVARWAYGQAAAAGSLVWQRGNELVPLASDWERAWASAG